MSSTTLSGWHGYIERDKARVLSWLREHSSREEIVASADFEDSFLLPVYGNVQPYVELFDFSVVDYETRVERYFQVLDFNSEVEERLFGIKKYNVGSRNEMISAVARRSDERVDYDVYQAYAFFANLIYYPYSKKVNDIFSTTEKYNAFIKDLESIMLSATASESVGVDLWLVKKDAFIGRVPGFEVRYQIGRYMILAKLPSS